MNGYLKRNIIQVKNEKSKENIIMKQKMLDALRLRYEADYKQSKITLDIYLKNAVGIGEHPQHFEEMDKLVDQMATAKDKLMTLNDEYGAPVEQILNESYGGTESDQMVLVQVRKNNVDQALRVLKKKLQKEGVFREIKENRYFEKPSAKRSRKKAEGTKRVRKNMLKRFEREGY